MGRNWNREGMETTENSLHMPRRVRKAKQSVGLLKDATENTVTGKKKMAKSLNEFSKLCL